MRGKIRKGRGRREFNPRKNKENSASMICCVTCIDTTNSQPVEQIVSVQRSVGQRVTFPCTSHNSDNTDWWRYQPGASTAPVAAHQISSAGLIINSFKTDGRFSLRSAFRGDSSLRIRNVNQSDGGVYICRTQHDDYEVQHQFQLTVLRK